MVFGDAFYLPDIGIYALAYFCLSTGIPSADFARELANLCLRHSLSHQAGQ